MKMFMVRKVVSLISDLKVMVRIMLWWCLVIFRLWVLKMMVNSVSISDMISVVFWVWVLVELVLELISRFILRMIFFSCRVM